MSVHPSGHPTQTSSKQCLVLTKLFPGSLYHFKVTAESDAGSGPASEASEVRLPPDRPGKLHAIDITHNSVRLEWTEPEYGASIVNAYSISVEGDQRDAQTCALTSSIKCSLVLNKLTPGSLYCFKVTAESNAGSGPASEVSEVRLPPDRPGKPHAFNITHNSVRLEWAKPEYGASIVNSYSIYYRSVDDLTDQWDKQTGNSECVLLTKLTPGTQYYFKVAAQSFVGNGPASEVGEISLPPDQPGKPHAAEITQNSLRLEWAKPEHGALTVSTYSIYYRSVDDPTDQWDKQTSSDECVVLTKLTPASLYRIKVTAESDAGSSPASEVSEVRLPPGPPGKPWATNVTHNTIQLQWPTKPENEVKSITSYTVLYRYYQFNPWSSHSTTDSQESALLTNLVPKRSYHVKVQAVSSAGTSSESELSNIIETLLPPPGKPYTNNVTQNGLHLLWKKPEYDVNCVQCYTVFYRSVGDPQDNWCEIRTNSASERLVFDNLTTNMSYHFKVRAETPTGFSVESELSDPIVIRLPAFAKPHVSNVTHNSVELSWEKTEHNTDCELWYTVSYCFEDNDWIENSTRTGLETMKVDNLLPGRTHYFKVKAETTQGSSGESNISEIMLPTDQPGIPMATCITPTTIELQWDKPKHGAESVQSYTVWYRSDQSDEWSSHSTTYAQQYCALLTDLHPNTFYYVKVQAINSGGLSPASELSEHFETLLPPPSKLHATIITQNSVILNWDSPTVGAASVQSYTIVYCSADERWHKLKTNKSLTNCLVGNLIPKTTYHFKIRAESATNVSPDSTVSDSVETLLPPPGKPYATNITHNSVQLSWEKPQCGAESVRLYTVVYNTDPESCWKEQVFQNSGSCSVYVQDLLPNKSYVFKVRGDTVAGSSPDSELSKPIKTLLPPPGRPYASDISYDSFQINWQKPEYEGILYYSILHRTEDDPKHEWHTLVGNTDNKFIFTANNTEKSHFFKVTAVTISGRSSESEISEPIGIKPMPLGAKLLSSCEVISTGNPNIHQLPLNYTMKKKDIVKADVGKFSFACSNMTRTAVAPHKVLILVGATGAGKSTLINGIANYIMGVDWEDDFRFKLITEDTAHDQTKSQTKCITAYTFHRETRSFPLPYTLTVIDTPGFGDTGGLERDKEIVTQIKEFFTIQGDEGIDQLHGIGFVVQAPQARLTPTQRYVFDSILAVLGKDVADNIFLMVNLSDGMRPPVLDAAKAANVPFKDQYFKFNNSALFACKTPFADDFNKMFWRMGQTSFYQFFEQFSKAQTQSLQISREVLQEREHLEVTIQGLKRQICTGLSKIDGIQEKKQILKDHEADIIANREFTREVTVTKQRKVDLAPGKYTTNCLKCNVTCHPECKIPNDTGKYYCWAMVDSKRYKYVNNWEW